MRAGGRFTPERRALWLNSACRHVLASMSIEVDYEGPLPERGLVVANHLSYLDIAILAAVMPCCFVAKKEINRWPYFGKAARAGGTIFLDRASMTSANRAAEQIAERLGECVPVLLFPEGTSTDGSQVLRFHGRLIQPAIEAGAMVTAAAIRYVPSGGEQERELCWFGDEGFLPHLWKVLGVRGFRAHVRFGEPRMYADRRTAATAAREEVMAMRATR